MYTRRGSIGNMTSAPKPKQTQANPSIRRWALALAASAALVGSTAALSQAGVPLGDNQYFTWHDSSGTVPSNPPAVLPGTPGSAFSPANNDFTPSPFLTDDTAAQVGVYLAQAQAAGVPLAVKVPVPLSSGGPAVQLFNQYKIKYVFADLEGPNAVAQTTALVNQVHGSTMSANANVGNYAFATVSNDPSRSPSAGTSPNSLDQQYRTTGVNLNTEQLYPGQPDYRQAGRDTAPDGSAIANLRTGFFMGPVMRVSAVSNNSPAGLRHIPYVSRFENFGNPSLDSDGNPANGFVFNNPTGDQMLSRQDFEAQMLHYRMRGATGFHLHEPGVVGYTQQQFQTDAKKGWESANRVFGTPTGVGTNVNSNPNNATPITTGAFHSIDNEGVVYSGVANQTGGGSNNGAMDILVSNLSSSNKYIVLPTRVANGRIVAVVPNADGTVPTNPGNGTALPVGTVLVAAGQHRLLQFDKDGNFNWNYIGDNAGAFDSDPTATARDGVGIPEPATISLLSLGAVVVLTRRNRRK